MKKLFLLLSLIGFYFSACKQGEKKPNQAPFTQIFLDTIQETNPISSSVQLYWTGSDPDGWVIGYEVSTDLQNWHYTRRTDTTILFNLQGNSHGIVTFSVRAIDNEGQKSISAPILRIPLRNSPPKAEFNKKMLPPAQVVAVATLNFTVSDPDGIDNVQQVFLKANNGDWTSIGTVRSLLPNQIVIPQIPTVVVGIVPTQANTSGETSAKIILNNGNPLSVQLDKFLVGGNNRIYLKVRDLAGEESLIDSTNLFFFQRKTSDLLLIESHGNPRREYYIDSLIKPVYGHCDYLLQSSPSNFLNNFEVSIDLILSQYEKVIWRCNGVSLEGKLIEERAAASINNFLARRKKLIMIFTPPTTLSRSSEMYNFMPVDSLLLSGTYRIRQDTTVKAIQPNWNDLYAFGDGNIVVLSSRPFVPQLGAKALYNTTPFSTWNSSTVMAASTEIEAGKTNFVFFTIDFMNLRGKGKGGTPLRTMLNKVLNEEFNWQ